MPIIERKIVPDSIVYSDSWSGYNVLDVSDFHHFRIIPKFENSDSPGIPKFHGT